jgi:hypothetical protein
MRPFGVSIVALLVALSCAVARADSASDPTATVRGYFEALAKNDYQRALALTQGAAQRRTATMVGALEKAAKAADAHVELKVRRVLVGPPPTRIEQGLPVPVDVTFDIDVVGKKWHFSKVARKLAGKAQFLVAGSAARILAIDGALE